MEVPEPAPSSCAPDHVAGGEQAPAGKQFSLWERMVFAYERAPHPKPHRKELNEAKAFFNRASEALCDKKRKGHARELVVDVCGSHGLVAMLFLAFNKATRAVVVDKTKRASYVALRGVWQDFFDPSHLSFVEEDLLTALPRMLAEHGAHEQQPRPPHQAAKRGREGEGEGEEGWAGQGKDEGVASRASVCVVACHACSGLSDSIISICADRGVDFAVMPCCHPKDPTGNIARAARGLGISLGAATDLVRFGKILEKGYDARWRCVDASITPENRVLVGLAQTEHQPNVPRPVKYPRKS